MVCNNIQVIANDDEVSGSITYSIVTGSTDDFMLDPDSGVIRTLGPLNRELVPQYIFTVQAVDEEGVDGRTSYAQVSATDILLLQTVPLSLPRFPSQSEMKMMLLHHSHWSPTPTGYQKAPSLHLSSLPWLQPPMLTWAAMQPFAISCRLPHLQAIRSELTRTLEW